MHAIQSLKAFLLLVLFMTIVFSLSACSTNGFSEPLRKSIVGYNNSANKISVTSVIGIQTFAKGRGPQNLLFGNLKATGYKSKESRGYLYIDYPVQIKWVNGFLDDPRPDWPTPLVQEIRTVHGLEEGRTEISEDASLILVFNGKQWVGYYAPKSSLLKQDINSIIESYQ